MRTRARKVRTRFGPEARFEVAATPPATFRALQEGGLEQLKQRLLRQRLIESTDATLNVRLRRAANEAAALAYVNAYPLLVFPVLFEEKVVATQTEAAHQVWVRERSRELVAA